MNNLRFKMFNRCSSNLISSRNNCFSYSYKNWKKCHEKCLSSSCNDKKSTKYQCSNPLLLNINHQTNFCPVRYKSNISEEKYTLSTFNLIIGPDFFKLLKAGIMTGFYIRPFLDKEFKLKEFAVTSKVAVTVISKLISEGRFSELEGLVTSDCIAEIERNINNWPPSERHLIAVKEEDIQATFLYNLVLKSLGQGPCLEMSLVYYTIKDYDKDEVARVPREQLREFIDKQTEKFYMANYRFLRCYGENASNNWIVNGVNHFKPTSLPVPF